MGGMHLTGILSFSVFRFVPAFGVGIPNHMGNPGSATAPPVILSDTLVATHFDDQTIQLGLEIQPMKLKTHLTDFL